MSRKSLFAVRLPEDRSAAEEQAVALVKEALARTPAKLLPYSAHEGCAFILAAEDLLWDDVRDPYLADWVRIRTGATHVAVVSLRLAMWCLSQHLMGNHEQQAFGLLDSSLATAPECPSAHEGFAHLRAARQKLWRVTTKKGPRKIGLWAIRTAAAAVKIIELALSQEETRP